MNADKITRIDLTMTEAEALDLNGALIHAASFLAQAHGDAHAVIVNLRKIINEALNDD